MTQRGDFLRIGRRRAFIYVKNKGNAALLLVLIMAVLLCMAVIAAELRLRPIVRDAALSRAKNIAVKAINDSIDDEMQNPDEHYTDIVQLEKDSAGEPIAVKLDMATMNRLKAAVIADVSERLRSTENMTIKIPLGNIINGELFSGRGPKITIKLVPVGSVNASFASEFTSAGINQTRHRILINTSVYISVMLPTGTADTEVISEAVIAETVIVGDVPDSYTNIEDNESELLDKINNYAGD